MKKIALILGLTLAFASTAMAAPPAPTSQQKAGTVAPAKAGKKAASGKKKATKRVHRHQRKASHKK